MKVLCPHKKKVHLFIFVPKGECDFHPTLYDGLQIMHNIIFICLPTGVIRVAPFFPKRPKLTGHWACPAPPTKKNPAGRAVPCFRAARA